MAKKPKDKGNVSAPTKKIKLRQKRKVSPTQAATQFKPGNKSGGRPKGSRNKFAEAFFTDFYNDWINHGSEAIIAVRVSDPSTYLRVGASMLPKELSITDDKAVIDRMMEKMNEAELDKLIAGLIAIGGGAEGLDKQSEASQAEAAVGSQSDIIH